MFYSRHKRSYQDTVSLAGWLFADLLLGLAMLFLVINSVGTEPASTPTATKTNIPVPPSPTPTTSPTATPTPIKTSPPTRTPLIMPTVTHTRSPIPTSKATVQESARIGLDLKPVEIIIRPDQNFKEVVERGLLSYKNRRAGLVLTFGYQPETGKGVDSAANSYRVLTNLYPVMFQDTINKSFWWDVSPDKPAGTLRFEIYFFTTITP
jgi:hypothetical protein